MNANYAPPKPGSISYFPIESVQYLRTCFIGSIIMIPVMIFDAIRCWPIIIYQSGAVQLVAFIAIFVYAFGCFISIIQAIITFKQLKIQLDLQAFS